MCLMSNRKDASRKSNPETYRAVARLFACPTCGAAVGQKCVLANGKERISVHRARCDLAYPSQEGENVWGSQIEVIGEAHRPGYAIYGIRDKATGQFGYVGQTGNFAKRIRSHLRSAYRGSRKRVACWMKEVLYPGGIIEFVLLEQCCSHEQSLLLETKWVVILSNAGHSLANRWTEHQEIIREAHRSSSSWPEIETPALVRSC